MSRPFQVSLIVTGCPKLSLVNDYLYLKYNITQLAHYRLRNSVIVTEGITWEIYIYIYCFFSKRSCFLFFLLSSDNCLLLFTVLFDFFFFFFSSLFSFSIFLSFQFILFSLHSFIYLTDLKGFQSTHASAFSITNS